MKLTIRARQIQTIPTLEVVPENLENQALPLVIYYHGWRNNKELMLTQARRTAQKGFRVILPDAMNHGERKFGELSAIPGLTFWTSIQYNLIEFQQMIDYFNERELILDGRIGVSGYSMGGITTAALLTQHPEIKVAASIMGTPQPYKYFHLMQHHMRQRKINVPKSFPRIFNWVNEYDLSLHPETLANRPVYFWHGTEDPKIPYSQAKEFFDDNQLMSFANELHFETGEGEGHLVTIELMETITDFFVKHL